MAQTVHRTDDIHPLIEPIADHVLSTEHHENAPAVVIRADEVQTVLSTLRTEAGLDHCACVTAQEYPDRYEEILNGSLSRRLYRKLRAAGLTQPVHRAVNRLRRLTNDPRVSTDATRNATPGSTREPSQD